VNPVKHGAGRPSAGAQRLRNPRLRAVLYQAAALALLVFLALYLFSEVSAKLSGRDIQTGFDFLERQAGFVISQSFIAYAPTDSFARAFVAGLVNSLVVSAAGIVLATLLGTIVGIARLADNALLAALAKAYVEALRGIPLLLFLFLFYGLIIETLPPVARAWEMTAGSYLSNRGLAIPKLRLDQAGASVMMALAVGMVLALAIGRILRRRRIATGDSWPYWPLMVLAIAAPLAVVVLLMHPQLTIDFPEKGRFRITGGAQVTPEFTALLLALALSTSAGIAEIVRAGILAIGKGQVDAARSLGLRRLQTLRLVILPQAARVIIPPLTSSYLTLFKNSSLAIAIGYPDFLMVANMAVTQTGQAIEIIAILVLVYLSVSSAIAITMNWYNRRMAFES
jgi:general L-amino acid transport system permease protein